MPLVLRIADPQAGVVCLQGGPRARQIHVAPQHGAEGIAGPSGCGQVVGE